MSYLIFLLAVVMIGTVIFIGGLVLSSRDDEKTPYAIRTSFKDHLVWGAGFFVAFSSEFSILACL
jgi:hypothetical protein